MLRGVFRHAVVLVFVLSVTLAVPWYGAIRFLPPGP